MNTRGTWDIELRDHPSLAELLKCAAKHVMTPEEIAVQRDNWVRAEIDLARIEQETTIIPQRQK